MVEAFTVSLSPNMNAKNTVIGLNNLWYWYVDFTRTTPIYKYSIWTNNLFLELAKIDQKRSKRFKFKQRIVLMGDDVCYLVSKPITGKTLELVLKIT